MAKPVLVAASDEDWCALSDASLLPASLFGRAKLDDSEDADQPALLYAGNCAVEPSSASVGELEKLDELLFRQGDGHLAVLFRCTGEAMPDLERFDKVSASWRDLIEQRKRRYTGTIRPVCIAIGADSTHASEEQFRQFLQGLKERATRQFFQDLFVMSPRLEPGQKHIFHARNVWPVSVGRLLLCISAKTPKNEPGGIFGWRFLEFRHTDPGILYERLLPACSDALFNKLRANGQPANLPVWSPSEGCLALEEEKAPAAPYWHAFPAIAEADRSTDPARILQRLSEAGTADAVKRAGSVLERWQLRDGLIGSFWKALHGEAGAAWLTETALRSAERAPIAILGNASDSHLESLPSKMQALKSAGESLKTGAAELAAAQSWFVQRWFRLAIALVAASLLGVMFFRGAQLKFLDLYMAGVVAAGCFLGALFAAALFYGLEVWRGEKGFKEWADRKKRFEVALAELNENLCGLKTAASSLSAGFANVTLHSKLLRLVSRLTSAVASVFQPSANSSSSSSGDVAADTGKTAIRYLEKSTVRLGRGNDLANETDRDLANHAVNHLMKTDFFDRLARQWKEVCDRSDAPPKGAVDAAGMHAAVADVMVGLPSEVDRIVSEANRKSSLWEDLNESLAELQQRGPEFGFLSVELSDTAQLAPFSHLLVSSAYAQDSGEMRDTGALAVPEKAETVCPVLLVEFSKISTGGDLTPLKQPQSAEAAAQ